MKKILFAAGILLCSSGLFGQSTDDARSLDPNRTMHMPGDVSVSLSGNMLNNNPFDPVMAGGFKMRYFVTKRLSLDTDLVFGKDYYHAAPGIIGLPLILLGSNFGFGSDADAESDFDSDSALDFVALIFVILSAEHVAYHVPLKGTTDISPFVSFLRGKNFKIVDVGSGDEYIDSHFSFATGIEMNKYFKRMVLSPYIEYNKTYDDYSHGFNMGVNVGYYFMKH